MSPINDRKSCCGLRAVVGAGSLSARHVMSSISSDFDSFSFVLSTRARVRGRGPRFFALELVAGRPFLVFTMVKYVRFGFNPTYVSVVSDIAKFLAFSNVGSVELCGTCKMKTGNCKAWLSFGTILPDAPDVDTLAASVNTSKWKSSNCY